MDCTMFLQYFCTPFNEYNFDPFKLIFKGAKCETLLHTSRYSALTNQLAQRKCRNESSHFVAFGLNIFHVRYAPYSVMKTRRRY